MASGFSRSPVPDSSPTIQQITSKSHSNCLSKSLIIVLILLAIPLFPSQAPDFITESILTEFWEIIHLLFIGIAVSYGLFSRKSAETVNEKTVNPRNDAYMSGISNLSSIFEDGFVNTSGSESDAQNVVGNYGTFQYLQSGEKIRSFVSKDETEKVHEEKVTQAWSSQYSKCEALVVVSDGKYSLGKGTDLKPLNLPIRSLRSSIEENDKAELKNRRELSSKFEVKGIDDAKVVKIREVDDGKVVKIRGVVPKNLEKKFEEVSGDSLIPWRSRSVKIEKGREISNFKLHSHCRPQSVGEIEFERLNSRSFQDSTFSNSPALSKEESKWDFWQNSVSHPKKGPLNVEASKNVAKNQPFTVGSALEMKRLNNLDCNSKDTGDLEEECGAEKGKQGIEQLGMDVKSANLARVLSRAKSVRTIKPNRRIMDEKEQIDGTFNKLEGSRVNHEKQEFDSIFRMPKPRPIIHDEGKDNIGHGSVADSEEEKGSEFDKSEYEDDNETNVVSDAELGSEVDRKAGEFIAKFKAQIRLQKTDSSVKGYGGW